jgi:O-antigen ligase
MTRGAEVDPSPDETHVGSASTVPPLPLRPLPRALWAALVFAPLLGWISALCMLAAASWAVFRGDMRLRAALGLRGPERWLPLIALTWWLTLLAGDLMAPYTAAWWTDFRFLLVILPACALMPMFGKAGITYAQIGRWATLSVWVTVFVIGLEYLITVQWAGMVHHRPRALSGNALFVSTMLVPMMLLAWLNTAQPAGSTWAWPWATYAAGLICLGGLLGARTSTLMAIALMPLPLLWLRRSDWVPRAGATLLACVAVVAVLALVGPRMSVWYAERWGALIGLLAGGEWSSVADYGIATRAQHWPAAWQAFLERPWLGHGFVNEFTVLGQHLPAGTRVLPTAHQQYLSFLLWSGVPGLLTGCLLIALPLLLAWNRRRGHHGLYAATVLCVPLVLHGLTDTVLDDLRIVSYHLMMTVMLNAAIEAEPRT